MVLLAILELLFGLIFFLFVAIVMLIGVGIPALFIFNTIVGNFFPETFENIYGSDPDETLTEIDIGRVLGEMADNARRRRNKPSTTGSSTGSSTTSGGGGSGSSINVTNNEAFQYSGSSSNNNSTSSSSGGSGSNYAFGESPDPPDDIEFAWNKEDSNQGLFSDSGSSGSVSRRDGTGKQVDPDRGRRMRDKLELKKLK